MKVKRILCFIFIIFLIISYTYKIYAAERNITEQGKSWINRGEESLQDNSGKEDAIFLPGVFAWMSPFIKVRGSQSAGDGNFIQLAGILQGLGIFIIAIVGIILGIRFMLATPNDKAKVKEAFMIYLVGSVIIIVALGIWKLMISILDVL